MLGVVVWADESLNKAIVWCEDHGDLAYIAMTRHQAADASGFGTGDLIQFDLAEHNNMRLAHNPKRIAQHYCSDITDVVRTAQKLEDRGSTRYDHQPCQTQTNRAGPNVVDFAAWRAGHTADVDKTATG